ncbi:MAG: helix-turn-helix domain-containing protein [Oscillospiraceae bacterium]|nr:helix-turn-helix domain-containing protein [Oscillospiraceae bacterium]
MQYFDIGNRLLQLRREKSLSQEQLANWAEVTTTYYGQVERNMSNVTVVKLEKICDVLGITLAEFFAPTQTPRLDSSEKATVSPTDASIQKALDRLTDAEKQSFLRILRELIVFRNIADD